MNRTFATKARGWLLAASLACLASAASAAPQALNTLFDYQVSTPDGKALTLAEVAKHVDDADIVLIGEWHGHPGVHRFQTELLQALSKRHAVALSMEQFSRDAQPVLNRYLADELGEDSFKREANAWDNYDGSYRPLIEFAKQHNIDVLAANSPKRMVSCIGRQGLSYLETLPAAQRAWFADTIDTRDSAYKSVFKANMHHGTPSQTESQYAAQLAWDATMAESMVRYHQTHPETQIVHVAGRFHIAEGLGTAQQIRQRNNKLRIALITPVSDEAPLADNAPDLRLKVQPLPARWRSMDEMREAVSAMKGTSSSVCE